MMFGSKVQIDKALLEKARRYAAIAGYSSVEEFISHIVQKEIARLDEPDSEDQVKKRLKGLGYLS